MPKQFRNQLLQTGWQNATRTRLNRLKRDLRNRIGEYTNSNLPKFQVEFRDTAGVVTRKRLTRSGRWAKAAVQGRQRLRRRVAERRRLAELNQRDHGRILEGLEQKFDGHVRIAKIPADKHTFRISIGRPPFSKFTVIRVNVRLSGLDGGYGG